MCVGRITVSLSSLKRTTASYHNFSIYNLSVFDRNGGNYAVKRTVTPYMLPSSVNRNGGASISLLLFALSFKSSTASDIVSIATFFTIDAIIVTSLS